METQTHPPLEERFLQPKGWRWHMFAGHDGETLRFGSAYPKHCVPKCVVVILPGLSEFGEKYFELANEFLEKKYAVYVIDWQGQGRSHRHMKKYPHRRISNGFFRDVMDLDIFIRDYVQPSAMHPEVGKLPLVMLAHSMGANIGLRYIKRNPKTFACAALSAPMMEIYALKAVPPFLRVPLTKIFAEFGDCSYVPGASDYKPRDEKFYRDMLTNDPVRYQVHPAWCAFDPALQVGGVTWRWLYHAAKTCQIVRQKSFLNAIKIPLLLGLAGNEKLVNNRTARKCAKHLRGATILELPEARHEILMEVDDMRNQFLKAFDDLIERSIITKK